MPMRTLFAPVLAALVLVAATGNLTQASGSTTAAGDPGPVYVDSTEILYLESYPVQVELLVNGSLPTPCHEIEYEVQDGVDSIDVLLWSVADPEMVCAAVLEPFELVIPLGSFETADLPVYLNGEEVGQIELGTTASGPSLVGAGWSFGFCLGYCRADLAVEGNDLVLTGSDREVETLYANRGTLTSGGVAALEDSLGALEDVSFEAVYGCPDCADGGAAYLELSRNGVTERIAMEFSNPPDVLVELYSLTASLMAGLETCRSNDLVEVAADCVAYQPD